MSLSTMPEPSPAPAGLSRLRTLLIFGSPLFLAAYYLLCGTSVYSGVRYARENDSVSMRNDGPEPNGPSLYSTHCARCHGETGKADGLASPHLNPWARKFGEEKFQLATTVNGIPSDADLDYVIHRGIPGTAMPSFEFLSEDERMAIVRHLRVLTWSATFARLLKRAEADDDVDIPQLVSDTVKQTTPGARKEVPEDLPKATPESLVRGEKIFGANCATCHGPKGAGDGPQVKGMKNDNGQATAPRDLARGVYKGGGDHERLYLRLALGMPGTPMPASSTLKPSEVGDLVNFVQSLTKPPVAMAPPASE